MKTGRVSVKRPQKRGFLIVASPLNAALPNPHHLYLQTSYTYNTKSKYLLVLYNVLYRMLQLYAYTNIPPYTGICTLCCFINKNAYFIIHNHSTSYIDKSMSSNHKLTQILTYSYTYSNTHMLVQIKTKELLNKHKKPPTKTTNNYMKQKPHYHTKLHMPAQYLT
jgi:hypothetical protein